MAFLGDTVVKGSLRCLNKLYTKDFQVSGDTSFARLSVTGDATVSGTLRLTNTTDVAASAQNNVALIIGSQTGGHLEFNGNEIMAKSNGTTAGTLNINVDGGRVNIGGSSLYVNNGVLTAPTIRGTTAEISNLNVTNKFRANEIDLQMISTVTGGALYISPSVKFNNSGTRLTVNKNNNTLTINIEDSTISSEMSGIPWSAQSKVKVSGTLGGVTTGTMDGCIQSFNPSGHTMTVVVSGDNSANVAAGTYTSANMQDFTVMVYERHDTQANKDFKVGIWLNCYDMSNSSSAMRIYGGTSDYPTAMIGNLNGAFHDAVNGINPNGWGIYTDNGFFRGTIVATDGRIGGFTLGASSFFSVNNNPSNNNFYLMPTGSQSQNYTVGGENKNSWVLTSGTTFGIDKNGGVYATSGKIGGWTITQSDLHYGNYGNDNSVMLNPTGTSGVYKDIGGSGNINGWTITSGANFGVTKTGAVYATSGKIAGWTIGANRLSYGSWGSDNSAMLCPMGTNILYGDSAKSIGGSDSIYGWTITSGETFGVTNTGAMYATSGKIAGWTINATSLSNGTWGSPNSVMLCPAGTNDDKDGRKTIGGSDIISGWTITSGETFGVTKTGKVYASSGRIGGWDITGSYLMSVHDKTASQEGYNRMWIRNGSDTDYGDFLVVEHNTIEPGVLGNEQSWPFWVRSDGTFHAEKGDIGGWTISPNDLYDQTGNRLTPGTVEFASSGTQYKWRYSIAEWGTETGNSYGFVLSSKSPNGTWNGHTGFYVENYDYDNTTKLIWSDARIQVLGDLISGRLASENTQRIRVVNKYNNCQLATNPQGYAGLYHLSAPNQPDEKWLIYMDSSGTVIANTSDIRYKDVYGETSVDEIVALLRNVKPINFSYKEDCKKLVQTGFSAQEIRDVLQNNNIGYRPYLVIEQKSEDGMIPIHDLNTPETDEIIYSLDYSKFTPILWGGWQIHDKRIAKLEAEIERLKKMIV